MAGRAGRKRAAQQLDDLAGAALGLLVYLAFDFSFLGLALHAVNLAVVYLLSALTIAGAAIRLLVTSAVPLIRRLRQLAPSCDVGLSPLIRFFVALAVLADVQARVPSAARAGRYGRSEAEVMTGHAGGRAAPAAIDRPGRMLPATRANPPASPMAGTNAAMKPLARSTVEPMAA